MELYPHQKQALQLLTNNNQFGLLMEQGTGKTIPILYHITNLFLSGEAKTALVVCPKYVIASWERDICKLPKNRQNLAKNIKIINYDLVWRRSEYQENFDIIVLDEAHNICNSGSRRTRWAIGVKRKKNPIKGANSRSKYRYILTGTPIDKGKLEQFYCLMEFLKPNFFNSYREFAARYLIERQLAGTFVNIIVGYRNENELLQRIAPYVFRVLKKDCLELPDKLEPIIVRCENLEKRLYKNAEKSFIEELMMNIPNPLVKLSKLRQICSGFVKDEYGEVLPLKSEKISILSDIIQDTLPNKLVIFTQFRYSCKQIQDYCDKHKIQYLTLNGDTKDKQVWKQFQEDNNIKVFIGQYQSAREGIDLFAANTVVFYEPTLDTRTLNQAADRTHRIGQTQPVSYYHLIVGDTIEEVILNKLLKGEDMNNRYLKEVAKKGGF